MKQTKLSVLDSTISYIEFFWIRHQSDRINYFGYGMGGSGEQKR